MKPGASNPLVTIVFFLALAALWEGAVRGLGIKTYLLPPLSDVATAFWTARGPLLSNGLVTLGEVLSGFVLAAILGAVLAVTVHVAPLARATVPVSPSASCCPNGFSRAARRKGASAWRTNCRCSWTCWACCKASA